MEQGQNIRRPESRRVEGFATRLRMARAKVKMSQTELGNRIDVDPSTISVWERGQMRRLPPEHVLEALAKELEVTPEYFTQSTTQYVRHISADPTTTRYSAGGTISLDTPKSEEVLWGGASTEPGVRKVQLIVVPAALTEPDIEMLMVFAEALVKKRAARQELPAEALDKLNAQFIQFAQEQERFHERVDS